MLPVLDELARARTRRAARCGRPQPRYSGGRGHVAGTRNVGQQSTKNPQLRGLVVVVLLRKGLFEGKAIWILNIAVPVSHLHSRTAKFGLSCKAFGLNSDTLARIHDNFERNRRNIGVVS